MGFAGKVWRLLVAIKDGLALLFLLLFFGVLYAALTARPGAAVVRDGALLLKLDGAIVEEPAEIDPLQLLLADEMPAGEYRARDLERAIRLAATDKRIKAVVLDMSRFTGGGLVHLQAVGKAMDEVRKAKKPVLTYAVAYADDSVLLAAHASEVWVDPLGGAYVSGPGGHNLYFGGLIEKLKINAHVFRVGTYKDFVEPYVRTGQSPEAKAARAALYAALWEDWKADVSKARPKARIAQVTADPVGALKAAGGDGAKAAVQAGLVDRIGSHVAFGQRVAELAGKDRHDDTPGAFAHTSLTTWLAANKPAHPGKAIGVVTVAGEIVDGKAGPGMAGGDRIAALIDEAQDRDLAALVVRVDSPGGSVMASERIREAIERMKAKDVPVVVSMANMAASGGYWVSTPASRIFAEPATITGSIGIFAVIPSFERTLADIGVTGDGVRTTPLSGQPDPVTGLTPEVEALLQANIENGYARFLGLVAKSRNKSVEQVDAVAQGRVWDGGTARQNGLVDQFGGLEDALAYAARLAKLAPDEWHPVFLGDERKPYANLLEQLARRDDDSAPPTEAFDLAGLVAQRQKAQLARSFDGAERLLSGQGVQAYCLECPVAGGAAKGRATASLPLLARIGRALGLI